MTFFSFAPTPRDEIVFTELDHWNAHISDADRTMKFSKMICSPFSFYRGTNHLFWRDFANHPELKTFSEPKTQIWIQGDLHVENFGSFHNDQGKIVYDLNDFDEAIIADYQYDLWRLAISLVLVARQHEDFRPKHQREFIEVLSTSYLQTIADCYHHDAEVALEFTVENTYGKLDDFLQDVEANESRQKMLAKWTNEKDGDRYYDLSSEKLEAITQAEKKKILAQMPKYGKTLSGGLEYAPKYFHVKDIARRLHAGTGSFGIPRFYIVIQGEDDHHEYDCILDMKRQDKPTAYHYLGQDFQASYDQQFKNDAQRHAIAYKALAKNTDDHLGCMKLGTEHYSIRERSPYKEAFPVEMLTTKKRFRKMAEQWGKILATSHSRADQDAIDSRIKHSFDAALYQLTHDKKSDFIELVEKISFSYADQVQLDWQSFKAANSTLTCVE